MCSSLQLTVKHAQPPQQCSRALKPFQQRLIVCLSHPQIAAGHWGSNMVTGRKCHLCFSRFWLFTPCLLSSKLLAPSPPDLAGCFAELITALWSLHEPAIKPKRKKQMETREKQLAFFFFFFFHSVTVLLIDLPRLCCSLSPWRES